MDQMNIAKINKNIENRYYAVDRGDKGDCMFYSLEASLNSFQPPRNDSLQEIRNNISTMIDYNFMR